MNLIDRFISFHRSALGDSSAKRYKSALTPVIGFLSTKPLDQATTADIAHWMSYAREEEELGGKTIRYKLKLLRRLLDFAIDEKLIPGPNPVNLRRLPKIHIERFERIPFTFDEYQAVLKEAGNATRHRDFWPHACTIGYYTGLRLSDVANLKRTAINLIEGYLSVHTKKKENVDECLKIPIEPELRELLETGLAPDPSGYVLPAMRGYYDYRSSDLSEWFKAICVRAGLPHHTFHSFRHGLVTRMINAGIEAIVIRSITGQSLEVLATYAHISVEAKAKAMEKGRIAA